MMMPLTREEIALLRCPRCTCALHQGDGVLACRQCAGVYELRDRGAELLPWSGGDPGPEWTRWREKLQLLQEWRKSTWDGSHQCCDRQRVADSMARDFLLFLGVPAQATVLDIGCGGGQFGAYLPWRRYWGLDPAPGRPAVEDPSREVILRGVGERLPLADSSFDAVLLCQTLDHCLDPATVILEARRVLKPGGILGIMQSLSAAAPVPPPLRVRIRSRLGRIKSRLRGRRRIDDAETKTVPLDLHAVISLVQPVLELDASLVQGLVVFLRARRAEGKEAAGTEVVRA